MWVIISLVIAAVAVLFAVQNNTMTSVHFFHGLLPNLRA